VPSYFAGTTTNIMKLRKLNRIVHRDLGYFFFAMTIIYAVSGIALNHRHQWNPNYLIRQEIVRVVLPQEITERDKNLATELLSQIPGKHNYKTHISTGNMFKVFIEGGSVNFNLQNGEGRIETIRKRPILNQFNLLHYNRPQKLWTWFSDIYAVGLFLLAITGLFILKGKNGIRGRGAWLTAVGIIVPLLLFLLYAGA
jgi:uncharacterized protein